MGFNFRQRTTKTIINVRPQDCTKIEGPVEMVNKRFELQVRLSAEMFGTIGFAERHS